MHPDRCYWRQSSNEFAALSWNRICGRDFLPNKLLARWVDRVFTAYRESEQYFPGARLLETGNPVRWTVVPQVKRSDKFTLLVFGGSADADQLRRHRCAESLDDL